MNTNGVMSPQHGPSFATGPTFMGGDPTVATVFDNPISMTTNKHNAMTGRISPDKQHGPPKPQGEHKMIHPEFKILFQN